MNFRPSDEQARIIGAPLAPLRVSAGAGTGKTTTVAHRIAFLIQEHGFEPEQVLGLTFTNKAAEELADRVRSVLGDAVEQGRQVEVHTYHGFASHVLTEFGALVGVERDASLITPTFTRQLLSTIVASTPLPRLNATWSGTIDRIRRLAAALGDHLVAPEDLENVADTDPVWTQRRDLLSAIAIYAREKRRLRAVDYADLIYAAHALVVDHPWVAERIRARYRAVVLDEYQDTNPGQQRLLTGLFGDGFPVTAVGDPDQTIYEWRGASLGNFRRFPSHFPLGSGESAPTLHLSLNRRSGQTILDVANTIRAEVDDEPRLPLTAAAGSAAGTVQCGWFEDAVAEAEWIAEEIHNLHGEGMAWSDAAVLFRKNKDIALVRDALAARDIPTEVANLGGLLSVPEVVELHAWLRVIDDPGDGPALARILTGSSHRLGMTDLAVLGRWASTRRREAVEDDDLQLGVSLIEAVDHLDQLDELRPEARIELGIFSDRYRRFLVAAQGFTLVELSRIVLDGTGAWHNVEAMSPAGRLSARLNLYRFLDLAEQWSPLEGRPSLSSFLGYLATMEEEPAEELDTARLAGADAVTLLTVHRAKGLEWPVVFVPGTYKGNFPSGVTGSHDNPYTQAQSLPYEYRLDREDLPPLTADMPESTQNALLKARHDSQEWRIAYVAATRAKERLVVTGAHWYGYPEPTQKPRERSPLYELVATHTSVQVVSDVTQAPDRPDSVGYRSDRIAAPDPVFGVEGWQGGLRQAVADPESPRRRAVEAGVVDAYDDAVEAFQQMLFRLPDPEPPDETSPLSTSVTGLVTYASCPRRFYWSEVDRLPRRYSPAARRGVDVHRKIELHHKGVVPLDEASSELYDLPEPAESVARPYDAFLGSRFASERPYLVEAPFTLNVEPGLAIRGRIDAVYRSEDLWEVVDFKSGRPSANASRRVQLQAYAVAVSRGALSPQPPPRLQVTFAYLGDGLVCETEDADEGWLVDAEESLGSIARGIVDQAFEPTPGPACGSCDFLSVCDAGRTHVGGPT